MATHSRGSLFPWSSDTVRPIRLRRRKLSYSRLRRTFPRSLLCAGYTLTLLLLFGGGKSTTPASPPPPQRSPGLIFSMLGLCLRLLGLLFASLMFSIVLEFLGMLWFWPEQGWYHSHAMWLSELG